ncbi:putative Protein involved in cellulose biosynthesis (CelD)-like protein [Candidatus Sulfobium mesophilum]|uniref:BioF2-like acetyltransferase domain-containing protein n=1 Tax=Candidatus Sulfobium mesophilum TaxID=2016548 RepID=A0A2U3QDK5_9BACT|nr:putative Protein involved in cellulose biosynthesis (CelD)-like protein [Candidatus Sulfobium mesophilum]
MLTIEEITKLEDFMKLAPEWNLLLKESDSDNIFLTWEWVSNWWNVYGEGKKLRVMAVRDDTKGLVAIAPLYGTERRVMKGVAVREIRFIGTGGDVSPDYLDVIIKRGMEEEVIEALVRHLCADRKWDVASLTDIRADSPNLELLKNLASGSGLLVRTKPCAVCPYIKLPPFWEEYLGGLSANMRYNVKRRMRNLEKAFAARYFLWQDTETLTSAMELLAALHSRRWEEKGTSRSFSTPQYNAFHQAVALDFARKGWLNLSCLELDGEIVGMFYDYRYGNKIYYYQAGFDPEFSRYSPGLALRAYVIRDAIEEGFEEVDLLKGAYDFKYLWTHNDRSTTTLAVGRGTLAGRLHFLEAFEKPRMKAAIKETLPESLLRLVR